MSPDSPRTERRYRRALWIVVGSLAAVAVVAGALNVVAPLRVTGASVSPEALVSFSRQSVVIDTNRQLSDVADADVRVDPPVTASARVAADKIAVDFAERLDYDTEYTVTVDAAARDGRQAVLTTRFRTPPAQVYMLGAVGDGGEQDILRATLGDEEPESVYRARGIIEYAVSGGTLAVARSDGAGSVIEVVRSGSVSELRLPGTGTIADVALSSDGGTVGYLFTSVAADDFRQSRALVVQTVDPDSEPQYVTDFEGEIPSVDRWSFLPQRGDVIAHLMSGDLIAAHPLAGTDPTPLGRAAVLYGASDDVRRTVIDPGDGVLSYFDLVDGSTRPAPSSLEGLGERTHVSKVDVVPDTDLLLEWRLIFDGAAAAPREVLREVDDAGTARTVFDASEDGAALVATSLSPNGEYVAVEVLPARTHIVERATGRIVTTWEGRGARW